MNERTWKSITSLTGRLAPSRAEALRTLLEDLLRLEFEKGFAHAQSIHEDPGSPARADDVVFPYYSGDVVVLGPEVFAAKDGSVLCWKGVNYEEQGAEDLGETKPIPVDISAMLGPELTVEEEAEMLKKSPWFKHEGDDDES